MLAILKVFFVFLLIVVMLRRKINLGATMLAAAVILGLLFKMRILLLFEQIAITLITPSTISLIGILVLIMVLESIMRRTEMLQSMTDSLTRLPWNPRLLVASIPAIIGFLPSAGGARFSAPLVGQATSGLPYKAEDKVFINYWFRHIWEFSLPLYPGLILASHMSGIALPTILLWLWPFTVICAVVGYWVVFRNYSDNEVKSHLESLSDNVSSNQPPVNDKKQSFKSLAINTWPLWVTVLLVLTRFPILESLALVLFVLILQKRYSLKYVFQTLIEPLTIKIVFLIWGIMAFRDVLQISGAINQMSEAIIAYGVPPVVFIMILPLLVGIITGLAQACIGVSFPLVMAMVEPSAAYVMLAYVSGIAGVMISPVHLCLILTVDYFKADFVRSYKPLVMPSSVLVIASFLMFVIFSK